MVSEFDVNDRCLGRHSPSDDKDISIVNVDNDGEASAKHASSISKVSAIINAPPTKNAFSHIMERSATVFSSNKSCNNDDGNVICHRFHLHNSEGYVTWTTTQDN